MACEHCLRGEAQNKDLSKEFIDALMSQLGYVGDIVFTGGEPSLVPEILEYALESAKRHEVAVGSFFIATNGKKITEDFVTACVKWYVYCEDNEITNIKLSQDDYHETAIDFDMLKALAFFREEEHSNSVIAMGKAEDWGDKKPPTREGFTIYDEIDCVNVDEGTMYLNVNGELIAGCEWSYEKQSENKICDISSLSLSAFEAFGAEMEEG